MGTARLYRRDGVYWVDLRQQGQPRRRWSLRTADKREAEKLRRQAEDRATPAEPESGPTFVDFYTDWLERVQARLDPLTLAAYERACREAEPVIGHRQVADLRRADARQVVARLATQRRQRPTVARLVAGLRACLADAVDLELLVANPFTRPGKLLDAAGLRSRHVIEEEVRFYTPDEQRQLLEFSKKGWDHSLYLATLLGLRAGLRRSEMLGLQPADLDLKARYLHVRRRVTAGGHVGPTKSEKSRRQVPVARDLAAALRAQLLRGGGQWLFPGLRGGELQDPRRFGDRFQRMAQRAGVSSKKQPMHALRHTFASNLLTAGEPIFKVSKWLGHSSIDITVNHYGHLIPSEGEHAAVDQFAEEK